MRCSGSCSVRTSGSSARRKGRGIRNSMKTTRGEVTSVGAEMSTDVLSLVSKVIDRAVEKSGYAGTSLQGGSDAYAGELLIDTLASQLLHVLGIAAPAPAPALSAHQDGADLARVCAEQTNRNRALARALGACDCWGEVATC